MKKPKKDTPKCPFCNSHPTIKKGQRKNKLRAIQKYQCKNPECRKYFTIQPTLQKNKTYPINLILNAISNLNLGYSLKQTTNYFKKHKIKKSTISYWHSQLKTTLPYHRIRKRININYKPVDIIKKKRFIHHQQPFLYQYHKPKVDLFLRRFPALKYYLENIEKLLPKNIFKNSERISQIAKETSKENSTTVARASRGLAPSEWRAGRRPSEANVVVEFSKSDNYSSLPTANVVVGVSESNKKINLKIKQNYATRLADIALQITEDNKQRHNIIENLMLKNDTATIATEVPVYLKEQSLTGHIDILQIRYHKLHILDFKPEKTSKQEAITQLYLYAKALSRTTGIPIKHFTCAYFDNRNYFEFYPYRMKPNSW